ncbi:flavin reductase family protein [Halogeometricum borinquense]|uniref:Flavin reductase family protein n=1 Tax=Halogeometricum borinquense TaxID=60847 RepID=A0A6C0UFZ9_9EURY|nr:flavin reductase family protein [Halogeometricum borinquense]QIB74137.1 flavin reductase family protein [Halogeometricum borinquense]QIQ76656.1 flavin reductase family protein [Halogeometricum borinquense]
MDGPPDAFGSPYRLLSGAVVPRPIAWVSTRAPDGTHNLAPYSFSNVATTDPPTLLFSSGGTGDDRKDSARNAIETGAFVYNVVTEDVAEAMNETSATLEPDGDEFEHAGVTPADSVVVDAPRVAEATVSFECRLADTLEVGASTVVLGEVVHAHVDESVLTDGKIDTRKLDAVGRLAGNEYARLTDRFSMERPP